MIVKQLKFLVPDPLNPFESIKDDELNLAWKGFSCDFQVLKTESDLKLLQNSLYLLNKKMSMMNIYTTWCERVVLN